MDPIARHNVKLSGSEGPFMMFAHGFGCDQNMWRLVTPAFEQSHRIVLFDHIGCGHSDPAGYDADRYGSLDAYADDVIAIADAVGMRDGIFVGHSVSAMIGVLAARKRPELFSRLVLIGPSPCYINDGEYRGGFERSDIEELLQFMDNNFLGWSAMLTPQIMGNPDRPELAQELNNSFCRSDPDIAKQFAKITFLSDNRGDLEGFAVPSLVLQCANDVIAPESVGRYVHERIAGSSLVNMKATGHCPNLSAPEETVAAIRSWL
jgi:sigma-B regulation protein RsbQ